MIRADTPPGTEVVCIDDSEGRYGPSHLVLGALYTVKGVHPALEGGWTVTVHEVPVGTTYVATHGAVDLGYSLRRFRYLELPPELEALQRSTRVYEDA